MPANWSTAQNRTNICHKLKTSTNQTKLTSKNQTKTTRNLSKKHRSLNWATLNDTTISLLTLQSIESNFEGSLVSTLDLSNCFYSIQLDESSKMYFNFFMIYVIWSHEVLSQGWSGSPKVSRDAIDETFSVKIFPSHILVNFFFLSSMI